MKKSFYIFLYAVFNCITLSAQEISVANEKLNFFYAGVDNPVSVAVSNIPAKDLVVKVTEGKIFKTNGVYYFRSDSIGITEVIIYNKSKEAGRRFFRIKPIPYPVFKIGSMRDSVPIPEIVNQQYVRAELEEFDIDVKFTVVSFTAHIISADTCKAVKITNTGNKLSNEIVSEFRLLKPKDIILFKDIYVTGPTEKRIKLKERVISVY